MTQVYLGKAQMVSTDVKNLVGVVTNPMQEAQASKISLFAIADYTWNMKEFNAQTSWENSFPYVEEHAAEALKELASHMAYITRKDAIGQLDESENLASLLLSIETKVKEKVPLLTSEVEDLTEGLETILTSSQIFKTNSKNEGLKTELAPFIAALEDVARSCMYLLRSKVRFDDRQLEEGQQLLEQGISYAKKSEEHERPMLPGKNVVYATPGQKYLRSFMRSMIESLTTYL